MTPRPSSSRAGPEFTASVVEDSNDAIITEDLNGNIVSWNKSAERIFGYTAAEAVGKSVSMLASPDRVEEVSTLLARAVSGERVAQFETVGQAKDGRYLDVSLTVSPVKDGDGRLIGVSKIARDFTGQRMAERQLALQAEELRRTATELTEVENRLAEEIAGLRTLHEFATRVVQATDLRSLLDEALTAARAITHSDMGDIQLLDGSGALRIECQHGFSKEFLDFFDRVVGSETAVAMQERRQIFVEDVEQSPIFAGTPALGVMLRAGARAVQSTPIITREGRLLGMFSTHYRTPRQRSERDLRLVNLLAAQAADLIERFRAEEALRNEREQLESITNNMPAAVTRCSRDLRYLWVSRAYASSLRRSKEEIEGRYIRDVIGEQGFEEIRPFMERVLTGERVEYSAEIHFPGADTRWIHAVYIPKRTRDQFVEGWTAVVTDITESVNQEQRLRDANVHLSRANEDLNHFAFAAGHDLQEPLRMIATYSQLLLRGYRGQVDEEASMCMRFIGEGTKRMQQLLADLLAYTQLVGEGPAPIAAVADLNAAFAKALENCRASVEEMSANVTGEPLPNVWGYEPHFVALFQNLISNALKYRSDQPPRVHVSATQENGKWRIGVADNGIGIDPEYHRMIFGVFKRLHGKTIPGTGIGLAICQRVVERYGGRIWVESQENHGATFYFSLPAAQAALADDS